MKNLTILSFFTKSKALETASEVEKLEIFRKSRFSLKHGRSNARFLLVRVVQFFNLRSQWIVTIYEYFRCRRIRQKHNCQADEDIAR